MNFDPFEFLPIVVIWFIGLIVLMIILRRILVNVGPREIEIK